MDSWLKRHERYEETFSGSIFIGLEQIVMSYPAYDTGKMENALKRLYLVVNSYETRFAWNEIVKPATGVEVKSFIFDMAQVGAPEDEAGLTGFWNMLMNEYLKNFLIVRILEIKQTTVKALEKLGLEDMTRKEQRRALRQYLDKSVYRVNKISRTETTNAMNKSEQIAVMSSKLPYEKAWICRRDERSREAHFVVDPFNFIPVNEAFIVGGERLMHPGDVSLGASAWNVINCRCRMRYRLRGNRTSFQPKR